MMASRRGPVLGAIAMALTLALVFIAGHRLGAASQLLSADKLRFQLVGDEPIAGPDGLSLVTGWKVLVFKDRATSRCYVTFVHGASETVASDVACAELQGRPGDVSKEPFH
jgi:hypothetical protein